MQTFLITKNRCVQVRFKVRSVSFTSLSHSSKGQLLATTTLETKEDLPQRNLASGGGDDHQEGVPPGVPLLRRRSSSIGLSPDQEIPAAMQITGSMRDFGLGLISWW